jgi:hypothetical protein
MSECEWESEVIVIDNDITSPGVNNQTNRTVTDKLIKKPFHEDFVAVWSKTGWHVRVSKQSCKQGNRLILWVV